MSAVPLPIPIYTTSGDVGAILVYPYLYDPQGEWIGWTTEEREVYSVNGNFAGQLSREFRILRLRTYEHAHPRREPPQPPRAYRPPAHFPLPPMMPELMMGVIDVLEEEPERLPPFGSAEPFSHTPQE